MGRDVSVILEGAVDRKKVLLLGASGRLGRIIRACWTGPIELIPHSRTAADGFTVFDPLTEADQMAAAMAGRAAVICLSGVTPARAAAMGDRLSDNRTLALRTMDAAQRAGVPRVLLASSAAVYGAAHGPLDEGARCHPVSDYGQAKLDMETAALAQAGTGTTQVTALRIGNVAGADAILGGWQPGMQLDQLPDGRTPHRSYIGPHTLTRVIESLYEATSLPEVINIAAPSTVEMGALLDAAEVPWSPRPSTQATIARVELSTKRLETLHDFTPSDSTASEMVAQWRAIQRRSGP